MSPEFPKSFLLGSWRIEPLSGSAIGPSGETHHLEPKVMEVLVCLALDANEVVTREQLLDVAWSGCDTSDEQLTRAISELRRTFHDNPSDSRYIETLPKRGYRLIQIVRSVEYSNPGNDAAPSKASSRFKSSTLRVAVFASLLLVLVYVVFDQYDFGRYLEPAVVGESSIAVLPFVNMSEDPYVEIIADGISEDIAGLLSKVPDLKVIGRTSSFAFKGSNEDLRSVGQKLGVNTLLEGSVRKSGDSVRVVAKLIDALDGTQLWSGTYDRTFTDIFSIQDDIASSVVGSLKVRISALPDRDPPTLNLEAYSAFLKARVAVNRLEWREGIDLLNLAVQHDPQFAEAYELLAYSYWYAAYNGIDAGEAWAKAYDAATRAIAINPDLLFAQRLYRSIPADSFIEDLEASEWAFRQQPGHSMVLDSLVYLYTNAGYKEEALRIARQYVEIDPLSLDANLDLFGTLYSVGHVDEAMQTLEMVKQIGLGPSTWQWTIAGVMLVEGDDEAAVDYFEDILNLYNYSDTGWVRELVTAARNPDSGQAVLDRRIPEIAASLSEEDYFNWQAGLVDLYLYFGFVDRYFELIYAAKPADGIWHDAEERLWQGHVFRQVGFAAHPDYLRFATDVGIVDLWEKRGPPDFCRKRGGAWACN